ncbi:hypothetical protein OJAV_G00220770 [Oryzias javanicus]|uniref:Dol-P-Glc:Glc(2)Man(9)GlcNAc(2)-PP-Dol alpha-1,2-glucosyltransferase n=1 Tax=Oryzias javanicus TaxID=123683 RepID=A0A437C0Z9_ORYJA|nr:hypothetical protein OJAV_G00220770 [Oryzias javanicus]
MEKFEGYVFAALCSTNFLVSCLIFSKVTREQREPYMDEIFHVPQAQKYCQGKFSEWDPMITTPPGLYLASVGVIKPVVWLADLTGNVVCSTAMLRFINLLFNCGNLYLIYLLLCKLHPREKTRTASRRILSALSLSIFPVLYFFNFLYYTDAGSTFFILCLPHDALRLPQSRGAPRRLLRALSPDQHHLAGILRRHSGGRQNGRGLAGGAYQKEGGEVSSLPGAAVAVLQAAWPYAAVAGGFLAFIVWNDGIVVGDRTSHEACLNFPQIFYFFCFSFFLSFPVSLWYQRVIRFLQALRKQPLLFLLLTVVSLLLVWKFTHVHKYLLADNRHYPFYVWKNLFRRHELIRFLLITVYIFAGWNFLDSFRSRSLFWTLAFLSCLLASTVPQKLLEFRYFIVPYLMYRLHMPLPSMPRLVAEFLLYAAVNAATIYVFIAKTFRWPDSADTQRFMW